MSLQKIRDTAPGLTPTDNRQLYLSLLTNSVDCLSYAYDNIKNLNDRWSQAVMMVTSIGALITSILTIANFTGWPFEIVPIVIQTVAGMMSGWMRFYDFPKRMEGIVNAKHSTNDVRERVERAAAVDEQLWDQICGAFKLIDSVLTPLEREKSQKMAFKLHKQKRKREAQLAAFLYKSVDELTHMKIDISKGLTKKKRHTLFGSSGDTTNEELGSTGSDSSVPTDLDTPKSSKEGLSLFLRKKAFVPGNSESKSDEEDKTDSTTSEKDNHADLELTIMAKQPEIEGVDNLQRMGNSDDDNEDVRKLKEYLGTGQDVDSD
uniref:Uncharacterized protein n=1 Tax=viral metagenome TaxID=1070528 RepID=A0A2V0RHN9_9ZZZZ